MQSHWRTSAVPSLLGSHDQSVSPHEYSWERPGTDNQSHFSVGVHRDACLQGMMWLKKPGFKGSIRFSTLLAFDQQPGFNDYNVKFQQSKSRVALKAFNHTAGWIQWGPMLTLLWAYSRCKMWHHLPPFNQTAYSTRTLERSPQWEVQVWVTQSYLC